MKKFLLFKTLLILCLKAAYGQQVWPTTEWPVSKPESESMIPDSLFAFDADIANGKYGYIDDMIITRNGKLIYRKSWKHDYDKLYGQPVQEFYGHSGFVLDVSFSPDGKKILSGSTDKTTRLWNIDKYEKQNRQVNNIEPLSKEQKKKYNID